MKYIQKNAAPNWLERWRGQREPIQQATYQQLMLEHGDDLRKELLIEQGGLCCFCNRKISEASMSIEHLVPQSRDSGKATDWSNLVASCNDRNTCNQSRSNTALEVLPTHPHCEKTIYLNPAGRLETAEYSITVNKVLNLNDRQLIDRRREVLRREVTFLSRQPRPTLKQVADRMRRLGEKDSNGHFLPFCSLLAGYLERTHPTP